MALHFTMKWEFELMDQLPDLFPVVQILLTDWIVAVLQIVAVQKQMECAITILTCHQWDNQFKSVTDHGIPDGRKILGPLLRLASIPKLLM